MADGEQSVQTTLDTEAAPLDEIPLHSTNLLTVLDETGVIQYESPAIERIYGYKQDELAGEQVAEYFHPDDRERVVAAFEAVVASEEYRVEAVEYRHRQADGSYTWVESVASANPTPQGHYVVNSRDVSERKRRERELEAARDQVEAERDGKEAIRQLLFQTAGDDQIAESVCRLLVDEYGYEAAWVVRAPVDSTTLSETTTIVEYGTDRESGGTDAVGHADDSLITPATFADVTEQTLSSEETVRLTADGDERDDRLDSRGLESVHAVPIAYDGLSYGALTAVRAGPATRVSRELLEEFASALAFKQQVTRQRERLAAETLLVLDIRLTGGHVLTRLAEAALDGGRLVAHELQHADGLVTYLLETSAVDAATLESSAAGIDDVCEATRLSDAEQAIVRVRVEPPTFGTVLGKHGGALDSLVVADGHLDLRVQFPRLTDGRTVAASIQDNWPDATIQVHHEQSVADDEQDQLGELTAKQEQALRAATIAGFFERPQRATAAEVAETLGVSRSTFLHHLRNAEQTVFTRALDIR
jgi:PAS domain S-box-containing protein